MVSRTALAYSRREPNLAHQAIVKLASHAREFLLVPQNVDDLHARRGVGRKHANGERLVPGSWRHLSSPVVLTAISAATNATENAAVCRNVPDVAHSCGRAWFGLANNWISAKFTRVENFLDERRLRFCACHRGTLPRLGTSSIGRCAPSPATGGTNRSKPGGNVPIAICNALYREPAAVALPHWSMSCSSKHVVADKWLVDARVFNPRK